MTPLISEPDASKDSKLNELLLKGEFPSDGIPAQLIGIKVLIFNPIHGSLLYGFGRYFGIPVGIRKPKSHIFDRPLELTLFESYYLLKRQILTITRENQEKKLSSAEFYEFTCENYPRFEEKYQVYEDLRDKKYIPRPGQKFGADFIVYNAGPGEDHSSFCIQVISNKKPIESIDVVTAGRLANSVKKKFILANPTIKKYFQFKWLKM